MTEWVGVGTQFNASSIIMSFSPWQNNCQAVAEISLLSLRFNVYQDASLGDFLLAPACPIEKVTQWEGFVYLISGAKADEGVAKDKIPGRIANETRDPEPTKLSPHYINCWNYFLLLNLWLKSDKSSTLVILISKKMSLSVKKMPMDRRG